MNFQVSIITKIGTVDEVLHQITGQCFYELISYLNSITRQKKFVYDGTIATKRIPSGNQKVHNLQSIRYYNNADSHATQHVNSLFVHNDSMFSQLSQQSQLSQPQLSQLSQISQPQLSQPPQLSWQSFDFQQNSANQLNHQQFAHLPTYYSLPQ